MKQLLFFLSLMTVGLSVAGQKLEDLSFGTDSTFEVMTWNIEWFPKNGQITVDYVKEILESLNIDLIAIQEIDDTIAFRQLTTSLDSYEGYLESSWFAGLGYVYNPQVIQINDIYEIYTTSPYWSPFPRSPMLMDLNFKKERIIVINNHFKCCGDGILDINDSSDEETRRYFANNLLRQYVDNYFPNENVIVLGDLNDELSDEAENNVFQQIIDDKDNYLFADFEIALGDNSHWSYPTWPSHLDHILITNELFDDFGNDASIIQTIKVDEYITGGWWEYEQNISDHRPVALKLLFNSNTGLQDFPSAKPIFSNYPNPLSSETTFSFPLLKDNAKMEIFNINGQCVFSENISAHQTSFIWEADNLPNGVYFARLLINNKEIVTTELVLKR
ncbi:MAG: hypothetical protein B7C24_12990 [Bacteroidetes bacterium 4572_77]|nr:MAG: hypothetical protein B7C24_12990 [Bacteroidetes bacterium 4572_77]